MHLFTKHVVSSTLSENVLFIEWNSAIEYFTHR